MSAYLFKEIPFYSYLTFAFGLLCVAQGIFVFLKNKHKNTNRLYFLFCVSTATWLFSMSFLTSRLFSDNISITLGKCVYTGVVFMPTLALHFVIEFLGNDLKKNAQKDLKIAYALTLIFLVLVWTNTNFISGIYKYSWGYFPRTGYIHVIHTVFVMATAFYSVYLLWLGMNSVKQIQGKNRRYYELKYALLAFLFVTFGSSDFLHNWGVDFFPIGCIFVALFITFTTYAIFKHELLGISIVIKKSLVYSMLLSTITTIYFSIVYITSSLLGDLTKAHSLPIILFILTIITLLFRPLEQKIRKVIDRLFYKKPREAIEQENAFLLQEVQKADQMRAVATLAAGMAHEIKNPLTSIKTFAEYLPSKYDDPGFREKFSRIVVDEVDRVNNIVKQLLEFSKPKELELKKEPIVPILDDTLNLLSDNLLKNKINAVKQYKDNPSLMVDKNQLRQAFLNLFLNAIQAMPNGGVLTVTTQTSHPERSKNVIPTELNRKTREWRDLALDSSTRPIGLARNDSLDGELLITISDTGYGIPKDQIPHIFDPFYTTKESGTGLGLSIVHGIVTKHGGQIKVESDPGKGAAFRIVLKNLPAQR